MEMSLSLRRRRVRIFHDVLRALDMPRCFRFLFDDKTNQLAMQACSFGDAGYHLVPDFQDSDWAYEITSIELLELLWQQCSWNPDRTYRVKGVLCPDMPVIIFDLNEAEVLLGEKDGGDTTSK